MNAPFKPETALTESQRRSNEQAAAIAAREVYAHWLRTGSEAHRQSYLAWKFGERDWPWPEPSPEEESRSDKAVSGLARLFRRSAA